MTSTGVQTDDLPGGPVDDPWSVAYQSRLERDARAAAAAEQDDEHDEQPGAGIGATTGAERAPVSSSSSSESDDDGKTTAKLMSIISEMKTELNQLREKLESKKNDDNDNKYKLKAIDPRNIEKPDAYDGSVAKYEKWYEKFTQLLQNGNKSWKHVMKAVAAQGRNRIGSTRGLFNTITADGDSAMADAIKSEPDAYEDQLKIYLRTYTSGELNARVSNTNESDIFELMREIVAKGRNKSDVGLINLKNRLLNPGKANKIGEIDRILTDWRHTRREVMEQDPTFPMHADTLNNILLNIIPNELVVEMRKKLIDDADLYKDDHNKFESALYDEIEMRRLDEERKKSGRIGAVAVNEDNKEEDQPELICMECWSENTGWIQAMVPMKRDRDDAGAADAGPSTKEPRMDKGGGGKGRGPCWICGGPHLQRECPHNQQQQGNGKGQYPNSAAWSSWRPGTFPGPSPAQWRQWLPKPPKGGGKKGGGKNQNGKGKGGKKGKGQGVGGKGKGQGINGMWYGPPLGNIYHEYNDYYNQWDTGGYYHNDQTQQQDNPLVPICAVRWLETMTAKTEQTIAKPEVNLQNRFRGAEVSDEDFPKLSMQVYNDKPKVKMNKFKKQTANQKKKQHYKDHNHNNHHNHNDYNHHNDHNDGEGRNVCSDAPGPCRVNPGNASADMGVSSDRDAFFVDNLPTDTVDDKEHLERRKQLRKALAAAIDRARSKQTHNQKNKQYNNYNGNFNYHDHHLAATMRASGIATGTTTGITTGIATGSTITPSSTTSKVTAAACDVNPVGSIPTSVTTSAGNRSEDLSGPAIPLVEGKRDAGADGRRNRKVKFCMMQCDCGDGIACDGTTCDEVGTKMCANGMPFATKPTDDDIDGTTFAASPISLDPLGIKDNDHADDDGPECELVESDSEDDGDATCNVVYTYEDCRDNTEEEDLQCDADLCFASDRLRARMNNEGGEPPRICTVGDDVGHDPKFAERAAMIREQCLLEREAASARRNAEAKSTGPLCPLRGPPPTPGPLLGWLADYDQQMQEAGWQRFSLAIDSGAAETVIPHLEVHEHPIKDTDASRNGVTYASATGAPIPNLGEQVLPLLTQEGSLRSMRFQAAPVDRALGSVKRMCSSGHRVVFDDDGSYVLNKSTGEINWLREEHGNYMLDTWIMPRAPYEAMLSETGFSGPR